LERVSVQVVLALEVRLPVAHPREVVVGGATSESEASLDEPFKVAVTVAIWSVVKAFAETENVPLTEPAGTGNKAGTLRLVELELRPTLPPPAPLRITVQVLAAFGANVPGLQLKELIAAATLTPPPRPARATGSPVAEAPIILLIVTGRAPPPESLTESVAITPVEMAVEFSPDAMH
jgi:hypothetical protein